ncbi:hypothetical protein LLG46_07995 [bacterium]|nr:hypothetical protein [bacterium]
MKRKFLYCRDPIFISVFVLYFMNRFIIKPITPMAFFHCYFNDLICIPFWLPPVLWFHRKLRIRWHDGPPTRFEVIVHLIIWSIFFEMIAPGLTGFLPKTVGDPWDVAAYWVGGAIASILWGTLGGKSTIQRKFCDIHHRNEVVE